MPRQLLLLDACVAINLLATDHFNDVADALDMTFAMVRQAAQEVHQFRDSAQRNLSAVHINEPNRGDIEVIDINANELALYVELAASVDDGEAATIAVAASRGLPMATDDRKARRVCAERGLSEPKRTLAMIRAYCDSSSLSRGDTITLLTKVRDQASFLPSRTDPEQKWWIDLLGQ